MTVTRGSSRPAHCTPSLNFYPASTDPIGTPSIQYGVAEGPVPSVLGSTRTAGATLRFFLNPGVMWVWVGAGVMAIGGLLAASPLRRRRRHDHEAAAATAMPSAAEAEGISAPAAR